MERRQLLKAAPAALLLAGTAGVATPAVAAATGPSVSHDAQDVYNALSRWALGYDSRNSEMMRSSFTEDARFLFFLAGATVPLVFDGIDAIMGLFEGALAGQTDQRRHVTTNPYMERVDARTIRVTTYLVLLSILPADPLSIQLVTTGVYQDTVVKGNDGLWRIRERILRLDGSSERRPE